MSQPKPKKSNCEWTVEFVAKLFAVSLFLWIVSASWRGRAVLRVAEHTASHEHEGRDLRHAAFLQASADEGIIRGVYLPIQFGHPVLEVLVFPGTRPERHYKQPCQPVPVAVLSIMQRPVQFLKRPVAFHVLTASA